MNTQKYNIVFLGSNKVGKTSYLNSFKQGDIFNDAYQPTIACQEHKLFFRIGFEGNRIPTVVTCLDCSGDEKSVGSYGSFWSGIDSIVVMFSQTSKESYNNAEKLIEEIRTKLGPCFPIVLCCNKFEEIKEDIEMQGEQLAEKTGCISYVPISVKDRFNLRKPFLEIFRHKLGNRDVNIL